MNEQQAVLQASGLTKRFAEGQIDVAVLHGIDLTVSSAEQPWSASILRYTTSGT